MIEELVISYGQALFYIGDMIKEAGRVFFCIDGITRFMCVSGRLSYAERELAASPPTFTSKKEAKDEMVHLFQDRGFFYLTGIALLMQFVYKQGHLLPFDLFQAFLASSGIQALFYLINRKSAGLKTGLVIGVSFIFLFSKRNVKIKMEFHPHEDEK
ncbi:hypothetical protein OE903_18800 [Bacillus sp. B6(2022)]|nr:hypothetical protein [Bacillus sp. B6(2022)]